MNDEDFNSEAIDLSYEILEWWYSAQYYETHDGQLISDNPPDFVLRAKSIISVSKIIDNMKRKSRDEE